MWALGLYDLAHARRPDRRPDDRRHRPDRLDGTVRPIDGVGQKLAAAADAGAACSCSPRTTGGRAAAGDHGLELVPVASFDEALAYLTGSADAGA